MTPDLALVVAGATLASLTFAAATMRWFRTRCTWAEVGVLLLATFMLFRPDWFMDHFAPQYESRPAADMQTIAAAMPDNGRLTVVLRGINLEGDELTKTVAVALPSLQTGAGAPDAGRRRLAEAGVTLMSLGDQTQIGGVRFGSRAQRSGWEQGWDVVEVKAPNPRRWSDYWVYLPAVLLLAGLWMRQRRRQGGKAPMVSARSNHSTGP